MKTINDKQHLITGGDGDTIASAATGTAIAGASTAIGGAIAGPVGAIVGAAIGAAANAAIHENFQDIKKGFIDANKIIGSHMLSGLPGSFG